MKKMTLISDTHNTVFSFQTRFPNACDERMSAFVYLCMMQLLSRTGCMCSLIKGEGIMSGPMMGGHMHCALGGMTDLVLMT